MAKQTHLRTWEEGEPRPLCLCGCGEPATLRRNRRVNDYIMGHSRRVGMVPLEPLRRELFRVKAERGLQVYEMGKLLGYSASGIHHLLYDKRKHVVSRKKATHVLRRLAGIPTHMTDYERQRAAKLDRDDRLIA